MKLLKRAASTVMVATLCMSLTACSSSKTTMWDELEKATKKNYNEANVTLSVESEEFLDEFEEMLGMDDIEKMDVSIQVKQQDEKHVSCVLNGSINDEEQVALGEFRYIEDTYYFDVKPVADLLSQSSDPYMKIMGTFLPTKEWIQLSMDDIKNLMEEEGVDSSVAFDQEMKDQKKLAYSISKSILPVLEEVCGNDYITKQGNKFTLTLNNDAINTIIENVIRMEKEEQSITKVIEAIYDAFGQYGNEFLVESYAPIKEELVDQLTTLSEEELESEKLAEKESISFSLENKKDSSIYEFVIDVEDTKITYEVETSKGSNTEIATPEQTIPYLDFVEGLFQF